MAQQYSMTMTGSPAPDGTPKLPSDAELLEQIAQGSQQAFGELVNRHGRYLYAVARSLCDDVADAEDVVQETLIAALQSGFAGRASVRTWLVAILIRQAALIRRRKKPQSPLTIVVQPDAADASDARLDLARMLQSLSPELRQVIILRELEQMSYQEIAQTLGLPRGTVESRLHRARQQLLQRFKGYQL